MAASPDPVQTARFQAANKTVDYLCARLHSERIRLRADVAAELGAAAQMSPPLDIPSSTEALGPDELLNIIESLRAGRVQRIAPPLTQGPTVFYEWIVTDIDLLDCTRFEARKHLTTLLGARRHQPDVVFVIDQRLSQLTTCCAELETVEAGFRSLCERILKDPVPPVPEKIDAFIKALTLARQRRMLRPMPLATPMVVFDRPFARKPGDWRDHLRVAQEDPPAARVGLRRPAPEPGRLAAGDERMLDSLGKKADERRTLEREALAKREAAQRSMRETERALQLATFARGEYEGDPDFC